MEKKIENTRDKRFRKKAEKLGYKVRTYSGRGMYGRQCLGITVDQPNTVIAEIGMRGLKIDNMGLSYIVYTG